MKKLLAQTYLELNEFHAEGDSETTQDDLFACVTFTPREITTSDIIIINAKRVNVFAQFDHRRHPDLFEEVIWQHCGINLL